MTGSLCGSGGARYGKEILFMKEEELAAAEDIRQERDVLAQMVGTGPPHITRYWMPFVYPARSP